MRCYTIFSIYGMIFICAKFFDVFVSSVDIFDLMTILPGAGGNCSRSQRPLTAETNISSWVFYSASLFITLVFILFFCNCNLICLCIDEDECSQSLGTTKLKILVEISIYAAMFNPVSLVHLLLRDCMFGYILVGLSLLVYSLAVTLFVALFAHSFRVRKQLPQTCQWKAVVLMALLILLQSVQMATCLFGMAVSYSFPDKIEFTNARYSFLALVALIIFSVFVKGIMNRLSLYPFLFKKRDHFFCERCCIDAVATFVNIFSAVFMTVTIVKYYWSSGTTLHYITLVLLLLSIIGSVIMCFFNCYCSLSDRPDNQTTHLVGDDGEELMRIENGHSQFLKLDATEDETL